MIDILLFPDVGSTIPYGKRGRGGGGKQGSAGGHEDMLQVNV